jgi:hypothetical protein
MPAFHETPTNYAWRALSQMVGVDDEALVAGDRRFTYAQLRRAVIGMTASLWDHGCAQARLWAYWPIIRQSRSSPS